MKYNEKQKELVSLRASEKSIAAEQDQRKSRAKLSIFWCTYIYNFNFLQEISLCIVSINTCKKI